MIALVTAAMAGGLDGLEPLPACTPDGGAQLVLPTALMDLVYDAQDQLWVADWAELSVRDAELRIVERVEPGSHGWTGVEVTEDDVVATSSLTTGWSRAGRLVEAKGPPAVRDAFVSFRSGALSDGGIHLGTHGLRPYTAEPNPLGPAYPEERTYGEPLFVLPERSLTEWLGAPRAITERIRTGLQPERDRRHALAVRSDGVMAIATTSELALYTPEGEKLTSLPVTWSTDAFGLFADRLFTVSEGHLRIWGTRGRVWEAEGRYSSAVRVQDRLLAADLDGQLWEIDPQRGRRLRRACLFESCAPIEDLPDGLPTSSTRTETVGRMLAWHAQLSERMERGYTRPVSLHRIGDAIVAAVLHPRLWETEGLQVATELVRMDARGRKVRLRRPLDESTVVSIEPHGTEQLALGDTLYGLRDLEPVGPAEPPDGPAIEGRRWGTAITFSLGRRTDGTFTPANGLGPRHALQLRSVALQVRFEGDRVLLSSWGRHEPGDAAPGATEVWCMPAIDGPPATLWPGVLATDGYKVFAEDRHAVADRAAALERVRLHSRLIQLPVVEDPSTNTPRWLLWGELGETLTEGVAALVEHGAPVVVRSGRPRPPGVPETIRWEVTENVSARLQVIEHGVVIWQGALATFHPSLLQPPKSAPAPDLEAVQRWEERREKRYAPSDRSRVHLQEHIDAGDLEAARGMLSMVRATPEQLTRLYGGERFPMEEVAWERRPPGDTFLVGIGHVSEDLWNAASEAGLPAAVLYDDPEHSRYLHPTLGAGHWRGAPSLGLPDWSAARVEGGRWVEFGTIQGGGVEWASSRTD